MSSAIIEDVKHTTKSSSALVAYYYVDFKDVAKRDVRGLLASVLLQLIDDSDRCWDTLHQLYRSYRLGSPTNLVMLRSSNVLEKWSIFRDKFRSILLSMHWTNVQIPREHHLLARRFSTLSGTFFSRTIPTYSSASPVDPSKIGRAHV